MSEMIIKADAEDAYQVGYEEGFHAGYKQAMSEMLEIVHCKDCKHCYVDGENVRYNVCELDHNKVQSDDWFCADGERRDGKNDHN